MPVPQAILDLVERFNLHRDSYLSPNYNETQVRREFIDPMFKALGWDVDNEKSFSEQWKEVVHEDAIKVGAATKAPDYSFRLGGRRLFFLEAKKPSINLKADPSPAYQLRRYAWTAKLPLSILTDFEEFIVYDTRIRPAAGDKASSARILYIRYDEYPERWDEIASIFSPRAIQEGAFDKYVESATQKRGTAEVDQAFLSEIEEWREFLARNIAIRNSGLSQRELNFAVQRIIDRIIFLRICEDRGVEDYGRLQVLLNGTNVYPRLRQIFERADERYNSGLFHFHKEKDRPDPPDLLTPRLTIDDKALKVIIRRLYYPESPYEFSVMPAETLGHIYERFLGSVIRLTPGHRAIVEEKPEVRKAGGVYYTPTYIVDYIVKNTVGKLLEDKKPGPRGGASKLRVLDPACGSGSFLLGAYQYLLNWHLGEYAKDPERWAKGRNPAIFQDRRGEWRLTTAERKRILINNIYGVDIDPQAVEVTKLSLLLKVLEGENAETLSRQLKLFHERALPDLGNNIKCGNSLIGPDYYESRQMDLFNEDEMIRINAFDWNTEFSEIMSSGGFDAVIGNPPYVRAVRIRSEKNYYKDKFISAFGAYDIYILFMEKTLELVHDKGIVGFITPNKYFVADYAKKLRHHLLTNASIVEIADLGKCRIVFAGALISTAITFFARAKPSKQMNLKILSDGNVQQISEVPANIIQQNEIVTDEEVIRVYQTPVVNAILSKLSGQSEPLSDVAHVRTGVMGFDYWAMDKYISDTNEGRRIATNSYVDRYTFLWGKKVRLYKRSVFEPRLATNCDVLSDNTLELFAQKKIVVRGVARRLTAMFDEEGIGILVAVHSVVEKRYDNKFLLGLLNSKLFNWIHLIQFYSARIPEGSLRYPISFLAKLPIRTINFDEPADTARHDKMISLVRRMLELYKRLASSSTEHNRTLLKRQIAATDNQIDRLVYELYDLTDEEIALIEEATSAK